MQVHKQPKHNGAQEALHQSTNAKHGTRSRVVPERAGCWALQVADNHDITKPCQLSDHFSRSSQYGLPSVQLHAGLNFSPATVCFAW